MAKLLIVDDDTTTRTFLKLAMQRDGHQITEARMGEECLKLAQQERQDMILLDAQMPNMDGFTCCAELKSILRDRCPPIIMITGLSDQASVDRAFAVGAIDYATKPIHMTVLKHRVRQVLRERELMQQLEMINQELAMANHELQHLARIDSLTQVANRYYFEEILAKEWKHLARYERSLGVILCDVDYFKQYNDLYGHLAGDRCLQEISQILKDSVLRSADLVARYGGEEFVILLPETDADGTLEVAKRIHSNLSTAAIPHGGSKAANVVTLSLGATFAIPQYNEDPHRLVDLSDQALYRAKEKGRNQTVMTTSQSVTI